MKFRSGQLSLAAALVVLAVPAQAGGAVFHGARPHPAPHYAFHPAPAPNAFYARPQNYHAPKPVYAPPVAYRPQIPPAPTRYYAQQRFYGGMREHREMRRRQPYYGYGYGYGFGSGYYGYAAPVEAYDPPLEATYSQPPAAAYNAPAPAPQPADYGYAPVQYAPAPGPQVVCVGQPSAYRARRAPALVGGAYCPPVSAGSARVIARY